MVVGEDGRVPLPWLQVPLRDALAQQRSHALLVQAAPGFGALEFIATLAQAWLCEDTAGPRPCGRCGSCHLVRSRTHPDLRVLMPEALRVSLGWGDTGDEGEASRTKKKPSRQIRIDEVRSAIDWVVQSSSRGRAKVMLLHPAEAMNLQAASALLKTLEEPPGQARLLLSTRDAALLLPTLRSRCQHIGLPSPGREDAIGWLGEQGVADAAPLLAAAGGAPLAALAMSKSGIDAAAWASLPQAVAQGQSAALAGWPVAQAVEVLQKLCHDAMVRTAGGEPRYFAAASLPDGADLARLTAWARTLGRVARHDEHPWNEALLVEALVAEGRTCWQEATTRAPSTRKALGTLGR
jgi:DNA polymerase-3 subunit delta'